MVQKTAGLSHRLDPVLHPPCPALPGRSASSTAASCAAESFAEGTDCSSEPSDLCGPSSALISLLLLAVVLLLELLLPPGQDGAEHRQVGAEVQGHQRKDLATHRLLAVVLAPNRPLRRPTHLLHRLSVPAVGRQAPNDRRQDHEHRLRAVGHATALRRDRIRNRTEGQRKALTPVSASPMTNWCTSDVPS